MHSRIVAGMGRKAAAAAGVIGLASLAAMGFAPSASAVIGDCPAQYFCLWDGDSFNGDRVQFHDNGWQNLSSFGFNDRASSAYNNTNRYARISVDAGGAGNRLCFGPGVAGSLPNFGWNNIASAVDLDPNWPCA
jgi:hypothetical protein